MNKNDDLQRKYPGWETGGVNAITGIAMLVLFIVTPCVIGVVQAFNR